MPEPSIAAQGCPGGARESVVIGIRPQEAQGGDADGKVIDGFRVAVACEVAKRVYGEDVTVDWVLSGSPDWELRDGKVDLIAALYVPWAKKRGMTLSRPYYVSATNALVVSQRGYTRYEHVNRPSRKVCAAEGLTAVIAMKKSFEHIERRNVAECLDALEAGDVDAVVDDEVTLAEGAARRDERFRLLDLRMHLAEHSMGVRQGDSALLNKVDSALDEIISDGTWAKFASRYLEPAGFPHTEPPSASD